MPAPSWRKNGEGRAPAAFRPGESERRHNHIFGIANDGWPDGSRHTHDPHDRGRAIGNEQPIQIAVERWYSPDLQMNVMIKRTDPRMGVNCFS